jgi:hypothetical protein
MNTKVSSRKDLFLKILIFAVLAYLIFMADLYKNQIMLHPHVKNLFSNNFKEERREELYVIPLSEEILEIHRRLNLTNPGYMGKAVELTDNLPEDIQAEVDRSNEMFKFNEFVSQLIPFDRELPDYRKNHCRSVEYSNDLPKVSVILAFYNEPFSMVMRTIYSVLKRSPPELIEEIILVDDCSDMGEFTKFS